MKPYDLIALAARVMAGLDSDTQTEVRNTFNLAYPAIQDALETGSLSWANWLFFELDEYLNDENSRRADAVTMDKLADSYRDFLAEASKRI